MLITAATKNELLNKLIAASEKVEKWPVSVDIFEGIKARSVLQNKLQHKHYSEIAALEFKSVSEVKAECKVRYGIPILMRRLDFSKFVELDFNTQIMLMFQLDPPVTSLFTTAEAKEYTDTMIRDYAIQGLKLTDPDDQLLQLWQSEIRSYYE